MGWSRPSISGTCGHQEASQWVQPKTKTGELCSRPSRPFARATMLRSCSRCVTQGPGPYEDVMSGDQCTDLQQALPWTCGSSKTRFKVSMVLVLLSYTSGHSWRSRATRSVSGEQCLSNSDTKCSLRRCSAGSCSSKIHVKTCIHVFDTPRRSKKEDWSVERRSIR